MGDGLDQEPASDADPLGLNLRVSARLANELLHCITSITPRARYYSFFPWAFEDYNENGASINALSGFNWLPRRILSDVNDRRLQSLRLRRRQLLRPRKKSTTKWRRRDFHNGRGRNRA